MTLFIIRGVSGSGKSYAAEQFVNMIESLTGVPQDCSEQGFVHLETDMWFDLFNSGVWEPQHLQEAHKWCRDETVKYLKQKSHVCVCNTFTTEKEIAPYRKIATDLGVPFVSLIADHDGDNQHNVPEKTLQAQAKRFKFHNRYLQAAQG